MPFDLAQTDLSEFRKLSSRWQDWSVIRKACVECALQLAPTLRLPGVAKDPTLKPEPVRDVHSIRERDRGLEQ
jgi:hypothetical protein